MGAMRINPDLLDWVGGGGYCQTLPFCGLEYSDGVEHMKPLLQSHLHIPHGINYQCKSSLHTRSDNLKRYIWRFEATRITKICLK